MPDIAPDTQSNHPLQITTRRHPLAVACYLLVTAFGALFISGGIQSAVIRQTISPLFVVSWEWTMLLGGVAALIGAYWRPLDLGLFAESVGALACALGLLTYTGAVLYIVGFSNPVWLLTGFLVIGCLLRAGQAYRDMQRVERAAAHPPESFVLRSERGSTE